MEPTRQPPPAAGVDAGQGEPGVAAAVAVARRSPRKVLVATVMTLGFGLCALVTGSSIGISTGWLAAVVGLLFAIVPLGIVVPSFVWIDRFEHEPVRRLLLAFAYGASVATAVSLLLNTGSMALLSGLRAGDPLVVAAVAVAPVVEETAKGLGLALLWRIDRDELDGIVDGLVYAGTIAAGFAFAENVLYLGRAFAEHGSSGLLVTFVLRGLVGPFAHPIFTACTGIGVGVAVTARRGAVRVLAPLAGWLLAVCLHALWNGTAVAGANGYVTTFLVTQVPVFVGFVALALWARRREGLVIAANLERYAVAGWFTAAEVAMVASLPGRERALAWARAVGGPEARRAMARFQEDATTLALLRVRLDARAARGVAPGGADRERALLDAVTRIRPTAMSWARWGGGAPRPPH